MAVETTPLLFVETSEHSTTNIYQTTSETLPVHSSHPPTPPHPSCPSPPSDSLPSYDTAQCVLTEAINFHSNPPRYLSPDVE